MTPFVLIVFALVYVGMALGRWPGLQLDRTAIALVGAVALLAAGAVDGAAAIASIDFPTLLMLLGLMVLSGQFAVAGFYDWCALRLALARTRPVLLLALVVAISGVLSALLANDVVVFAMTPLLCGGLKGRGLDPRPFLIGLAGGANAGSAATVIGNPQNILIGQAGHLGFWSFLGACAVPAFLAMLVCHATIAWVWRGRFIAGQGDRPPQVPAPAGWDLGKAVLGTVVLLALFLGPLPRETAVLAVAAVMLVSRRVESGRLLGQVDGRLLLLFAALFVVTGALAATGLPDRALAWAAGRGLVLERLSVLTPLSLLASNSIGNVPAVILLTRIWHDVPDGAFYALAVLSTLAGNLLLPGSLANIIVAERAAAQGVRLSFATHARCGVPMTLLSIALAIGWLLLAGYARW
jgi:Na+/H+ antiporter NhaD/arsenite permease-like protein